MEAIMQRTRIIFKDFTLEEKHMIDNLVSTSEKSFLYEDYDNNQICVMTGMKNHVKKVFPYLHIKDDTSSYWPYESFTPYETPNAQPRNQLQKDYIDCVLSNSNNHDNIGGILSPGAGKTFMSCYCALKLGLRTIIISPRNNINEQWYETLIGNIPGQFNIDPNRVVLIRRPEELINFNKDFACTTQATLQSLNKRYNMEKVLQSAKFGIKIIDEVQMWYANIVKIDCSCNIANNWYMTGTLGRSGEEENELYHKMFSSLVIFREEMKKPTMLNPRPGNIYGQKPHMISKMYYVNSGLSPEEVKSVMGSMRYLERQDKWVRYGISIPAWTKLVIPPDGSMTKYLSALLSIIKTADKECPYGSMLVLVPTINSCNILKKYLEQMFPKYKIGTINSYNTAEENARVKAECDIMISTVSSAGTGFDVKGLSKLVVASPFKSWIQADQVSGRLRRRPDGRDTYYYDLTDTSIKQLMKWALVRSETVKAKSKKFTVIDI